jgi:hypothetical protein
MRIARADDHGAPEVAAKASLAILAIGAFFFAANAADAKLRTRDHTKILHSRSISGPRSGLVQRRQSLIPGDIYDSLSGGRTLYPNPDRDFSGPNAGGKIY